MMLYPKKALRLESASEPVGSPAPQRELDLTDTYLEIGLFRSKQRGDFMILAAINVQTGEQTLISWDQASPTLKAATRRWAQDPLGLLSRYDTDEGGTAQPQPPHPGPVTPTAGAANPEDSQEINLFAA